MPGLELWAEVKDGQVIPPVKPLPGELQVQSLDNAALRSHGWYPVDTIKPDSMDSKTEVWEAETFEVQEEKVIRTLTKRDKTAEELQAESDQRAAEIRNVRDRLLNMSDWVVVKAHESGTEIPDAWKTYRTGLRDISDQEGFPWDITWPSTPEQ